MTGERLARIVASCVAVAAAVGTLIADADVEVTLLMVTAVVAGLICFDVSMERRLHTFGPWLLLSLAPVLKTVPEVWFQLRSENGLLVERYDHAGSLLFGLCVFGAMVMLARPAPTLGQSVASFDAAVIFGSAVTGALAGASVAFLLDTGFGSVTAGRILETPTWFVLAGILAAVVVAAGHTAHISLSLQGVLATAAATSALLALSVAGRDLDRGWWALAFAALATSAVAGRGDLGSAADRTRRSNAPIIVALIVGLVAAASAIAARSDRTAWSPGWALLGVTSLAMFGLALASKPIEDQGQGSTASGPLDIGLDDDRRARRARARALNALDLDLDTRKVRPGDLESLANLDTAVVPSGSPTVLDASTPAQASISPTGPSRGLSVVDPATTGGEELAPSRPAGQVDPPVPPTPATPVIDESPRTVEHTPSQTMPAGAIPASPQPAVAEPVARVAPPPTDAQSAATQSAATQPAANQSPLSDASLIASAKAAAAVRNAPPAQRHSLAPLAHAHHFDPSTGLLSSAGLQHALARAFDVPRQAGHVTMLMFTIRDLDQIERDHGRLASAAVTREVADRITALLPNGDGARFARAAYAVIFVGDRSDTNETTQWLARVLLQLRAPVEGGSLGDKIDVVAGMAQCYESEDAANFVKRANSGLARAVQLVEPTLVAMP